MTAIHSETMKSSIAADAVVSKGAELVDAFSAHGEYLFTCVGPVESRREEYCQLRDELHAIKTTPGLKHKRFKRMLQVKRLMRAIPMEEKWVDTIDNLVTTVGKNLTLDTILAGSAFTATVVMGLKGTGTAVVGDTQASHAGWLEVGLANAPTYTAPRKTPAFSAASGGVKSTSAAVSFPITGSGTVAGAFININGSSTIDNTTGTLFSAGDFTGGNKTVSNGDTLSVTYSATLT